MNPWSNKITLVSYWFLALVGVEDEVQSGAESNCGCDGQYVGHLYSAICIASEALFKLLIYIALLPRALVAVQAGFRTRHITTHSANQ